MNFTRGNYRMMREELLKIVYWKDGDAGSKPRVQDKIEAAKNVVMMDLALLSAEIANGMYKKPVDTIAKEYRYDLAGRSLHGHHRLLGARGIIAKVRHRADGTNTISGKCVSLQRHSSSPPN
jgi:hypothetical protein